MQSAPKRRNSSRGRRRGFAARSGRFFLWNFHAYAGQLAFLETVVGKDELGQRLAIPLLLIDFLLGFAGDLAAVGLIQLALDTAHLFVGCFVGGLSRLRRCSRGLVSTLLHAL